jgi:hypothetical protein
MKKLIRIVLLLCLPTLLHAQTETFDMITFQPPQGWKKTTTQYAVSYSLVDNISGTWCQLAVYSSVATSGNAATDFSNEWKALVKPETYAGSVEPAPGVTSNGDWTYSSGTSGFKWQGKDSYVSLLNIRGHGMMASIHISSNSDKYNAEVESFLKSIQPNVTGEMAEKEKFKQPVTAVGVAGPSTTETSTNTITDAPGVNGIATATTNFDDGWVAQPFADYVKVVNQQVTVLLHYAIAIDDEMRAAPDMGIFFWDRLIMPRYDTDDAKVLQNEPYTYNKVYFVKGSAVDNSTGKNCYVGLRVLVNNGVATCIEIIAPTANAFAQTFPDQSRIESMVNYNKFAVSAGDLVGTWEESTSSSVALYYTSTGGYAGANATAMATSFTIRSDGTYSSEHKGAYGRVGSMTGFDQKYNGKYTLTPWDVTMTNRFEGKTDSFWCRYEAVRGGRVLYLNDKAASAITYRLVKTK